MTIPQTSERSHVYLGVGQPLGRAKVTDQTDPGPVLVRDTDVPAIARRLDSVDEELMLAEMSLYELVRQLEPVLPFGFGQDSVPPREPHAGEDSSPLAGRLTDLAARTHSLVNQLKVIAAAVDL